MSDKAELFYNEERLEFTLRFDLEGDRHVRLRANERDVRERPMDFAAWAVLAVLAATKDGGLPSGTTIEDDGFAPTLVWCA